MVKPFIPSVGDKFQDWTYIGGEEKRGKHRYILCKCKCGKENWIEINRLKRGEAKACRKCVDEKYKIKHELSKSRFYHIRQRIQTRCYNKKFDHYHLYGGRGIICEWKSFEEFKNDMYESYIKHVKEYGEDETSIDRIDTNGNYNKGNCKWSTHKEQQNNTRTTLLYDTGYTLKELADKYGLKEKTIYNYHEQYKGQDLIDYLEGKGRRIIKQYKGLSLRGWGLKLGISYGTLHKKKKEFNGDLKKTINYFINLKK